MSKAILSFARVSARAGDCVIICICTALSRYGLRCARCVSQEMAYVLHYCFAGAAAVGELAALEHAQDASALRLKELFEKRKALAVERAENKRELRNEARKRKRLLSKVNRCSVDELMNAVVIKSVAQAKAKAKAAS